MTLYERIRFFLTPLLPAVYSLTKEKLDDYLSLCPDIPLLLDVGGRKSPYTIGLNAEVTILDLPRVTDFQREFNLGITNQVLLEIQGKRSNVAKVILEDMTKTSLPDDVFDAVVAVEVIEHIENDTLFVKQIHRVLKQGGFFLCTTPNADHPGLPKAMPPKDYRYYEREQLHDLLAQFFDTVDVEYAVPVGKHFSRGLQSWSICKPVQTFQSMWGNLINGIQARRPGVKDQAIGTRTLIAVGWK